MTGYRLASACARSYVQPEGGALAGSWDPLLGGGSLLRRRLPWRRCFVRCKVLLQRSVGAPLEPPATHTPPHRSHIHPATPHQPPSSLPLDTCTVQKVNSNSSSSYTAIRQRLQQLGETGKLSRWQVHLGEVLSLDMPPPEEWVEDKDLEDTAAAALCTLLARLEGKQGRGPGGKGGSAEGGGVEVERGVQALGRHWEVSQHWQEILGRRGDTEAVQQVQSLLSSAGSTPKDWLLLAPQLVETSTLNPALVVEALGNFLCGWELLGEGWEEAGDGRGGTAGGPVSFPPPGAAVERLGEVKREAGDVRATYRGAWRAALWLQEHGKLPEPSPSPPSKSPKSPSQRRQEFFLEMHSLMEALADIGALNAATSALARQLITLMEQHKSQPGKPGNLATALLMLVRQWERHRQQEAAAVAASLATAAAATGDTAFGPPPPPAQDAAPPPALNWKQAMAAVRAVGGSANEKSAMERYQQCMKIWQQSAAWQEVLGEPLSKHEQRPGRKVLPRQAEQSPTLPPSAAGKAQQLAAPQSPPRIRRLTTGWASSSPFPTLPLHPAAEASPQYGVGSTPGTFHPVVVPVEMESGGGFRGPEAQSDTMTRLEAVFHRLAENEAAAAAAAAISPSAPRSHSALQPQEPMLVREDVPLLMKLAESCQGMTCAEGTLAASLLVLLARSRLRRRLTRTEVAAAVEAAGGGPVSTCLKSGTQQMEDVWRVDPTWQTLLGPPRDLPSWVKGRVQVLVQRLHQQGLLPASQPLPEALALAADLDYGAISVRATGCVAGALGVLLAEARGERVRMGEVLEGVRAAGESATLGALQSYVTKCRQHWEGSEVWRELLGSPEGRRQTIINPPLDHLLSHLVAAGRLHPRQLPLVRSLAERLELKPRSRGNFCVALLAVLEDGARRGAHFCGPRPFWQELMGEVAAAGARVNSDSAQRFHKKVVARWKEDRELDELFGRAYDYGK